MFWGPHSFKIGTKKVNLKTLGHPTGDQINQYLCFVEYLEKKCQAFSQDTCKGTIDQPFLILTRLASFSHKFHLSRTLHRPQLMDSRPELEISHESLQKFNNSWIFCIFTETFPVLRLTLEIPYFQDNSSPMPPKIWLFPFIRCYCWFTILHSTIFLLPVSSHYEHLGCVAPKSHTTNSPVRGIIQINVQNFTLLFISMNS